MGYYSAIKWMNAWYGPHWVWTLKDYALWKKSVPKDRVSWFLLCEMSRTGKPVKTKSRSEVIWDWGWGEESLNIPYQKESMVYLLFSHKVISNSLWPPGLQHVKLPCPSPSPRVCSNSCPLSQWCHPTIWSSVVPFSSCLQSSPASGSSPVSQLFASSLHDLWLWVKLWLD